MHHLLTLSLIYLSFSYAHSMSYISAPFKYTYKVSSCIFGKKTFLEYAIYSYLKTIPLSQSATKEELKKIVTKQAEEHFKTKLATNSLYFVYFIIKSNDKDFENKLSKQVDLFLGNTKSLSPSTESEKLRFLQEKDFYEDTL